MRLKDRRTLQDIRFSPIMGAAGVQGFFGEGYPRVHRKLKMIPGFDFSGLGFVAKTTTLEFNEGNAEMEEDGITFKEAIPKCIFVSPLSWWRGAAINAVGLSGPGADALLNDGRWQRRTEPFLISFMSVAKTAEKRNRETDIFLRRLQDYRDGFQTPFGLQINFSCPNVGVHHKDELALIDEVKSVLDMTNDMGLVAMPKLNTLVMPYTAAKISQHPGCDALCISNTIPWSSLPFAEKEYFFKKAESPLQDLGGGGVSGKPLLPWVIKWVEDVRRLGVTIPINAGGGILHPRDVFTLKRAGASSVFLGSVAFLRPWRVRRIIKAAYQAFGQ